MAKKKVKAVAKKPLKKAVKKASKKSQKKVVKKAAKQPLKKASKKIVKKTVKKAVKKTLKKQASKPVAKKVVKKAVKKIVAKKVVAKKAIKKPTAKKIVAKPAVKAASAPKFVAHSTHLKAGDKAPYFEGIDQNGNTVSLNSLAGKTVIIYFYPKDDTPGCTAEACSLRDEYQYLGNNNYAVVGVSADDAKSHAKFAAKYDLPFPLIADTNMSVIKAFDVYGTKQFMGKIYDGIIRTTFVIAPDGVIKNVVKEVNTKEHAKQILAL